MPNSKTFVENCTKDPRNLMANAGVGRIMFSIGAGETLPIDAKTLERLKRNPAVRKLFDDELVREVPDPAIKAARKAEIKADRATEVTKKKTKKAKVKDVGI